MSSMRTVSPLRSTTLWVPICIIALVVLVFWQQAVGAGIFIGESDRLNSYLNMRLWEYDAFVHLHKVPSWNNTMFGGFPASALHWMNPGTDPIALLLRWFSRPDLFQVLGYVSITLVVAACLSAYLYFYELVNDHLVAALAGLTYGLSVMSLHRISQVDNAYFTILALPFAFFILRRLKSTAGSFVALALTLTALTYWGFLQEVAYAFFILGFYALYRAFSLWRSDRAKAINTIFVFASASFVSILFAVPRLLGIAQEMSLLSRTSALQYYGYPELLRFFHEGVFGRTFEENRLLGNGMNVHEGLQLSSSTAAAFVVWLGVLATKVSSGALCCDFVRSSLRSPLSRVAVWTSNWSSFSDCDEHCNLDRYFRLFGCSRLLAARTFLCLATNFKVKFEGPASEDWRDNAQCRLRFPVTRLVGNGCGLLPLCNCSSSRSRSPRPTQDSNTFDPLQSYGTPCYFYPLDVTRSLISIEAVETFN